MLDPSRIEEGMTVLDCRGRRVGWVLGVGQGHLHVGRGWLSVKDYVCQVERIMDVRGDRVVLDCRGRDLLPASAQDEAHYVSAGDSPGFLPERDEAATRPGPSPERAQRRSLVGRPRLLRKLWKH